jgi:hypothetical protein
VRGALLGAFGGAFGLSCNGTNGLLSGTRKSGRGLCQAVSLDEGKSVTGLPASPTRSGTSLSGP